MKKGKPNCPRNNLRDARHLEDHLVQILGGSYSILRSGKLNGFMAGRIQLIADRAERQLFDLPSCLICFNDLYRNRLCLKRLRKGFGSIVI